MSSKQKPKILVVDDLNENLKAMQYLLKKVDADIVTCDSGKDALGLCLKYDFALVLLDVQMPEMDGYEVAEYLKLYESTKHIPIIFLTAISKSEQNIQRGYDSGAIDYICKPLNSNNLIAKVRKFIDIYNANRNRYSEVADELEHTKDRLTEKTESREFEQWNDTLTMLCSRLSFEDKLDRAVSNGIRFDKKFGVILFDIQNFKWINSRFGYKEGDKVLQETARRIISVLRRHDVVARLGSDKFAVLAVDLKSEGDIDVVVKKLFLQLNRPFKVMEHEIKISFKAGISTFPEYRNSIDIIKTSTDALRRVSEEIEEVYLFASDKLSKHVARTNDLKKYLTNALAKGEFYLLYQPIVNLKTEHILGLEALLRWNNPELGTVLPNEFIPICEKMKIINDIGLWTIEEVCNTIKKLTQEGITEVFFSVNLSHLQLEDAEYNSKINSILKRFSISPENIDLEINESMLGLFLSGKSSEYLSFLKTCKNKITIDDFGAAYCSADRLTKIPIDTIKIDGRFIAEITNTVNSNPAIKGIIAMAEKLNKTVIAECIETREQVDFLLDSGCNIGQGFYFYSPLDSSQILKTLKQKSDRGGN